MSNYTALKALFTALHGSIPYEYDEKYLHDGLQEDAIVISKTSSDSTIYITANMPDDNDIFNVVLYDATYDDDPIEICQWDLNDPNLNLVDLIAYIEKTL